jgi:citrate lyase beta subunit
MMMQELNARSWLFAPGDSERKMGKAVLGGADIVFFDLEDAGGARSQAQGTRAGCQCAARTVSSAHGCGCASIRCTGQRGSQIWPP